MAFGFYRAVTIDHTKCGASDSTDFPVGFIGTYAWCATVANGGRAQSASGFDIRPYADTSASTARVFQLVNYNATTGAIEQYWKEPTLSHTVDTADYMFIGDASIVSDGSSSSTWNSAFAAVYHFGDGSTLSLSDATANARTLTNNNAVTAGAAPVVGGSASFNGTTQNLEIATAIVSTTPVSISMLFDPTTVADLGGIYQFSGGAGLLFLIQQINTLALKLNVGAAVGPVTANNAYTASAWNYMMGRNVSSTSHQIRVNTVTASNTTSQAAGTVSGLSIGARHLNGTINNFSNTLIDEVRVSNVDRGDDWALQEYNNLTSPSTFYTVGNEVAVGGGSSPTYPQLERGIRGLNRGIALGRAA